MIDAVVIGEIIFDITVNKFSCQMHKDKVTIMDAPAGFSGGGDAQNAATTMGNLGMSVYLAGRVGDDEAGRMCLAMTGGAGVDCSRVTRVASGTTGTSVNLVNEGGEASHVCCPGENTRLSAKDMPFDLFGRAKYVSLHSLMALPSLDVNGVFRAAREGGAKTFADTTPIRGGETIDTIADTLPLLDVFAPSHGEISFLLGIDDPEAIARELLARGVGMAVVKLGPEGCYVADRAYGARVPAYKVEVVNATGAGDNFAAGFLYGLCRGYPKESCGKIGNACGAITAASLASTGVVKSFDQVREFIEANGDTL
jgi:sugar/nucleoside kinase (ribokinase family)